jgi:Tfp pilus assembly protein PilE
MMVVVAIIGILAAIGIPKMIGYIYEARSAEAISYLGKIANLMDGRATLLNNFPGAGTVFGEGALATNNMGEMDVQNSANFTYNISSGAAVANGFCIAARPIAAGWAQTSAANPRCIYYSSIVPAAAADIAAFDASQHFYKQDFSAPAAALGDAHTNANPLCTVALCTGALQVKTPG